MSGFQATVPIPCSEKWEDMAGAHRDRFCTRCAMTIYDVSAATSAEIAALAATNERVCVRSRLDATGAIAIRPEPERLIGGLTIALAALGALTSGMASAHNAKPTGSIAGMVSNECAERTIVTAIGANGDRYSTKLNYRGRYKLTHLAPGTYRLEFHSSTDAWSKEGVEVGDQRATMNSASPGDCIVVGMLERPNAEG